MNPPGPAARVAPSAARNREPILHVLQQVLPPGGLVLEVASGSGEHARWFSEAMPQLRWQPTDRDPDALASIAAWRAGAGEGLLAPLPLDAASQDWPVSRADAVVSVNMIHIAPWAAAEGLLAGAGRVLPPGAPLVLYGPFREGDAPLAPGNAAFDADLRARNPAWGLREVAAVAELGRRHGLALEQRIPMPANNLVLVLRRR